jgi:hypothetical protein
MVMQQLQERAQGVRDLGFIQLYVPLVAALRGDYLVSEAVRPRGLGGKPVPGQVPQRRLGAGGINSGELGGVEGGVQGNPGEAAATSHVYAHAVQCPAPLVPPA